MILHDNFVFIHLPHSAGLFTQSILCKYVPENEDFRGDLLNYGDLLSLDGIKFSNHNGVKDIPKEYKNKFKFGIVKNPYKWYASYYHYNLRSNTELFKKNKNFNDFMDHMNSIYSGNSIGRYSGFFLGLFTINKNYTDNDLLCDLDYLCDVEKLKDELFIVFDKTDTKISEEQKNWIKNLEKYNTSEYYDYRDLYNDELIDKVYQWDNKIIDHFNYKFE